MPEESLIEDELNKVFSNGQILNASDVDLKRFLQYLCSGYIRNEAVRHRETNRCVVINTIKTFRLIDQVEKTNKRLTVTNLILTVCTVALAAYSIYQSTDSTRQIERLIQIQQKGLEVLQSKPTPNPSLQKDAPKRSASLKAAFGKSGRLSMFVRTLPGGTL